MNGVTGRMGTRQHLIRSMVSIIEEGGVKVGDDLIIMPKPLLVGRNADKLKSLCASMALRSIVLRSTKPWPCRVTTFILMHKLPDADLKA